MVRNTATKERTTPAASSGEEEIRALVDAWSKALEAKDIDALTAGYAPDAVLFDIKPPYRVRGVGAIRRVWEEYLPCLPAKFTSERRDFVVTAGGDAAFVHCLHHIRPIGEGSRGPDTPGSASPSATTGSAARGASCMSTCRCRSIHAAGRCPSSPTPTAKPRTSVPVVPAKAGTHEHRQSHFARRWP